MKTIDVLIADDEEPAREELRFVLADLWPEAELHEAVNGEDVLAVVDNRPIDVLFLDINMPEKDGLAVAAELLSHANPPHIVFATAYDEHALKAFDLAAVDYVVKPFNERRLVKTIGRLKKLVEQGNSGEVTLQALSKLLEPSKPAKLWAERSEESRVLLDYADICYVEAANRKVYVGTSAEKLLVRHTLRDLADRLIDHNFIQVHRAFLVNTNHIAEVVTWFNGGYLVRMRDDAKTEIPVSRRFAAKLMRLYE